ncbi:hypothetical protein BDR06DRAFT_658389 [Suillus hirtellus]|nr:hypothetical protein BDR06DRAFT_658389 [Suillus hirtellus]
MRAPSALLRPISDIHGTKCCFKLGNSMLSSCTGKKGTFHSRRECICLLVSIQLLVCLAGPVKGRSAVCRDLDTDLRRISQVGACCIVCCLDDKELNMLVRLRELHEYLPEYNEQRRGKYEVVRAQKTT